MVGNSVEKLRLNELNIKLQVKLRFGIKNKELSSFQKFVTEIRNWVTKMMIMMNCFCSMVDRRKAFSLISSLDHCQRSWPSRISDTAVSRVWTCTEPEFRLRWMKLCSSAVVITTTPQSHDYLVIFVCHTFRI